MNQDDFFEILSNGASATFILLFVAVIIWICILDPFLPLVFGGIAMFIFASGWIVTYIDRKR